MTTAESQFEYAISYFDGATDLLEWASTIRADLERILNAKGVLLIRGLKLTKPDLVAQLLEILFNDKLMAYRYGSTPRTEIKSGIYTATEYDSTQTISQHSENAYSNLWALRIGFACLFPPSQGGQTPISDNRAVYNEIPIDIRAEFERKKIRYIRNYSNMDLPWSEVFCTDSKSEVEKYCNENNIFYQWLGENDLRTTQTNSAVQTHPVSNEKIWFNQAHLFHSSNLNSNVYKTLESSLGIDALPRHVTFGDKTEIDVEYLDVIREVFVRNRKMFSWQRGDLMLLDNMLFSHGREPFQGVRKVVVGMARAWNEELKCESVTS